MKLRPLDFLAVLIAILAVVGVSVFALGSSGEPTTVSIQGDEGEFLYPLSDARVVSVSGPIGDTIVEIMDGKVRVTESPCRDKICIAAGWLTTTGDWTACLPNRVFVRIEGGERNDGVDAQSF